MSSQRIAQALVGLTVILILAGGVITPEPSIASGSDFGDWRLWRGVIEGMQGGEGYYEATNRLLRQHNYALRPFIIWRLPTLATISSIIGPPAMKLALITLACAAVVAWMWELLRQFGKWAVLGCPLVSFWVAVAYAGHAWLFHDTWVGLLIALSFWFYSRKRWACVGIALLTLLIREHAVLYVLVMLGFAAWQRHGREVFAWLICLVVFGSYLVFHAYMHARYVTDGPLRASTPSLGWPLLVRTAIWTLPGFVGGHWLRAAVIPLALLGAMRSPRLFWILCAFLCAFMFTAASGNQYWGLIYAPLLAVGLVYAVPVLAQLGRCAWPGRPVTASEPTPAEPM